MLFRKFLKRILPLSALAIIVMLAACGDNGDNGNGDTTDATETTDTEDTGSNGDDGEADYGNSDLDGPIMFGDYGWESAIMHNRIAQFILENGYGYETDTIPGETVALFQGLINGDIDVSMEVWVDQNPEYEPAVEAGDVIKLGPNFADTYQGWYVPTYVIEGDEERGIEPMAPDLEHVDDLPEYWELFQDPEDPDKGRLYAGVAGWVGEAINEVKFEYYGLGEHYNRFLPGSGAALNTSLMTAYEAGEPWLGYTWEPTWVHGQTDLTLIQEPEYSDECWEEVTAAMEENRPSEDACEWPVTSADIAASTEFVEEAPDVIEFLENYESTADQVSEALAFMAENEVGPDEAAMWYLEEHEDQWTQWIPEQAAEDVLAAMENQ